MHNHNPLRTKFTLYPLALDIYALNQPSIYGIFSPMAMIHGSRNQGVEMGAATFTIIPNDPLAKFCSSVLVVLIPKGGILLPGDMSMIPMNWKLRLLWGHFGLFMPLNQQVKKGVTVLAGRIDPDYRGKLHYYSTMEVRKSMSEIQ